MGDDVGAVVVGLRVGDSVGRLVVGRTDGDSVTMFVGDPVGESVTGMKLAIRVCVGALDTGLTVGLLVIGSAVVGALVVGLRVGDSVGRLVVGRTDGDSVTMFVGDPVGAFVTGMKLAIRV